MGAHALLSASGSNIWLNCPASVRLTEHLPDRDTSYTLEGTLAHEVAELKLRTYFEGLNKRTVNAQMKKIKANTSYGSYYAPEMEGYTDVYLDYIKAQALGYETKPYAVVERKVDYSSIAPEGFGTCDCILVGGGLLTVVDFKYGKGVAVSAQNNTQLMLYALGAYNAYHALYPIQKVKMAIVQPRLDSITEWEISIDEILEWGESIKPIAEQAYNGGGECASGEHCKFCKIKGSCRARAEDLLALTRVAVKEPHLLTAAEIGTVLGDAKLLKAWAADLEQHALMQALDGVEIPGWKAVAGRSNRQFTDQDAAIKALQAAGVEEAMLYVRKPLSLSAVEQMMGKSKFSEVAGSFIIKPAGAPTLVHSSDNRDPIQSKPSAAEAFKNIEN